MRKYFIYELKKNIFIIGALTLAALVIYLSAIFADLSPVSSASGTYLWLISTIGGLYAAFVPVWIFSYKMKRRSVDLYFSLPLSHMKVLAVKYLVGLLAVFIPYTAAYWLGAFSAMKLSSDILTNAVWYLPQYFASVIPIYIVYSISAFVFTRANTVWDGLAFMLFWLVAIPLVAMALERLTSYTEYVSNPNDPLFDRFVTVTYIYPNHYYAFAPIDFVTSHFQQHLAGYLNIHPHYYRTAELVNIILGFTLTTLMSIGATVGLFMFERKVKAENVSQISESPFGYKVMLPFITAFLLGICGSPMLFVLITVCAFFFTVAYRRTFKIGKIQAIVFPASVAAGLILVFILY